MPTYLVVLLVLLVGLIGLAVHDLTQRRHSILRAFPVIGRARFLLERLGPELRQYIVAGNDEERPFSRDERRWVYASAKGENNYFGFGTDADLERSPGHVIVKHAAFPLPAPEHDEDVLPAAKVLGAAHGRKHAVRAPSIVNISGMSFGALSGAAIEALNRGAAGAGAWHNTGEGAISPHHQHGGDLVFQVGTAYFGCRTLDGRFDLARLVDLVAANPVRALEVKLSQGAKPGLGGMLPGTKVTPEIAAIRGIEVGKDCKSPAHHTAFTGIDGLVEFVETLAAATGLPVGIKTAVGDERWLHDLAARMARTGAGPDFVTVDGGEGGTGAAPLAFTDHVSLPFKLAFSRTYAAFARAGIANDVVFIGSGKLGFPQSAAVALALGADMLAVGREAMLSLGCIQAQKCHTGHCPTGVATQSKYLSRALDPTDKAARVESYLRTLRHELLLLTRACGVAHPALLDGASIEFLEPAFGSRTLGAVFGYEPGWGVPAQGDVEAVTRLMAGTDTVDPVSVA